MFNSQLTRYIDERETMAPKLLDKF